MGYLASFVFFCGYPCGPAAHAPPPSAGGSPANHTSHACYIFASVVAFGGYSQLLLPILARRDSHGTFERFAKSRFRMVANLFGNLAHSRMGMFGQQPSS